MTTLSARSRPRGPTVPIDALIRGAGLAAGALALGAVVSIRPLVAVAVAVGLLAVVGTAVRPVAGVYALVALTPLTTGIDRGTLLPVLRPNEAVCGIVAAGLLCRWIAQLRSARDVSFRIDALLAALLALAITDSIIPLLWLRLRGEPMSSDDLLYALVLWKFLAVYLVVRAAKLTDRQIWRSLQLSVTTAAVVSVVSLLQTAGWGPVVSLLKNYYTTNDNTAAITNARGSSTLGLPIAVADLLVFNLAILMGVMWVRRRSPPLLIALGWLLTLGVIGAGEFSGFLGLLVGVATVCVLTRSTFAARFLVVGGTLAVPFVWTVIKTRLEGFQSVTGLPVSWTGRLTNLHTYFWPVLFSDHRYLLGVRPAARVLAPHRANGYVWIESGYTWLLWAGGIPLLLAFFVFVVVAVRVGRRAMSSDNDACRIVGLAAVVAVTVIAVLMLFDPHLTYRGVADELFLLLALCAAAASRQGVSHA